MMAQLVDHIYGLYVRQATRLTGTARRPDDRDEIVC